jgi:hypothetical protein
VGPSISVDVLEKKEVSCCVANRTTFPRSSSPWLSHCIDRAVSAPTYYARVISVYLSHKCILTTLYVITAATMCGRRVYKTFSRENGNY